MVRRLPLAEACFLHAFMRFRETKMKEHCALLTSLSADEVRLFSDEIRAEWTLMPLGKQLVYYSAQQHWPDELAGGACKYTCVVAPVVDEGGVCKNEKKKSVDHITQLEMIRHRAAQEEPDEKDLDAATFTRLRHETLAALEGNAILAKPAVFPLPEKHVHSDLAPLDDENDDDDASSSPAVSLIFPAADAPSVTSIEWSDGEWMPIYRSPSPKEGSATSSVAEMGPVNDMPQTMAVSNRAAWRQGKIGPVDGAFKSICLNDLDDDTLLSVIDLPLLPVSSCFSPNSSATSSPRSKQHDMNSVWAPYATNGLMSKAGRGLTTEADRFLRWVDHHKALCTAKSRVQQDSNDMDLISSTDRLSRCLLRSLMREIDK
ncbi:hypothetical protein BC940DRAFT_315847 [Gongronella butleri]|nr:hypothetical protein BC940DRAFT_315847 [Gongronella butleri]